MVYAWSAISNDTTVSFSIFVNIAAVQPLW